MSTHTPFVTPLVSRVAAELGVDLDTVTGTGTGGRITTGDVRAAAAGHATTPAPAAPERAETDDSWFPGVGTPDIPA